MKWEARTDPVFQKLTIPASPELLKKLRRSLLREGCREPIRVWDDIIVDGHKRYEICTEEGIDFPVEKIEAKYREEVVFLICSERVSQVSKGSAIYKYLIGKEYHSIIWVRRQRAEDSILHSRDSRASLRLSEEYGAHYTTIEQYGAYAQALDQIYEKNRDFFSAMMDGSIRISFKTIREVSAWDEKKLKSALRQFERQTEDKLKESFIRTEKIERNRSRQETMPLSVGIKEMPAFDPDMELRGLSLTIPAWENAIARVRLKADMELASVQAREQLAFSLLQLEEQIEQTLGVLNV